MNPLGPGRRSPSPSLQAEQGYLLLGLLFIIAVMMIGLAIAAPMIAKQIQREKEAETIHRGDQYKRAIQLYYRKFGHYPMSIDQLKKTDEMRFLRQEYIDPMTGKKDWKLLHLGEVPMVAMGLFGKPMATAGAGGMPVPGMPGSGMPGAATPGAGAPGNTNSFSNAGAAGGFAGSNEFGGSVGGSSSLGNNSSLGGSSGSNIFGNSPSDTSSSDTDTNGAATNTADTTASGTSSADSTGQTDNADSSDQASSSFGSPGSSPFGSTSGGTQAVTNTFGSPGQSGFGALASQGQTVNGAVGANGAAGTAGGGGMFGGSATGAPIIGVTVPLKKKSILSYRMKTIYNQWYFIYNPQEEVAQAASALSGGSTGVGIGTPAGSPGNGSTQTSSPFGTGSTGSGIGSSPTGSSGFGGSSSGSSGFGGSSSGFGSSGLGSSPNNSGGIGGGSSSTTF